MVEAKVCESTWERGLRSEAVAVRWVEALGWRVVGRNVRYRVGELDIVAWDNARTQWVFVEVRSRYRAAAVRAEDTVLFGKQVRLARAARRWMAAHASTRDSARFDVIAVDGKRARVIAHHKGAFEDPGV